MITIQPDALAQGVLAIVALLVLAIVHAIAERRRKKREAKLAARELAVIVEHTEATAVGMVSLIMLIVTVLYSAVIYLASKTVFQQIEAGVALIAGCIIWGLGVALGRTRTLRVYRSEHRDPV